MDTHDFFAYTQWFVSRRWWCWDWGWCTSGHASRRTGVVCWDLPAALFIACFLCIVGAVARVGPDLGTVGIVAFAGLRRGFWRGFWLAGCYGARWTSGVCRWRAAALVVARFFGIVLAVAGFGP